MNASQKSKIVWVQDNSAPSQKTCLANVFTGSTEPTTVAAQQALLSQARAYGYEPCGKKMRKHADGEYYCSVHGLMLA